MILHLTLSEHMSEKQCNSTLTNKLINWEYFQSELSSRMKLNILLQTIEQLETEVRKCIVDNRPLRTKQ